MNRLLILLCLFAGFCQAQGQTVRGYVVDGETGKALGAVTVQNTATGEYAYTSSLGEFTLRANKGDWIGFSFIGYKTQQKAVPAALGVAEMHIELFRISYELDEFVYRPRYTPYQLDSMERKSTYQRALARRKSGSVMSPVTLLAEKLSRSSRQLYRFQKSFNYWEDVKFIESRYTPQLVQQLTGLSGDTLAHFININPLPFDYARVASDLELKIWIRERFREWARHPTYPAVLPAEDTTRAGGR